MDKILLEGIRLEIRVGTTEQERSEPQLCGLDLVVEADLKQAGRSGDLRHTVDYAAMFRFIEAHCSQNSFTLLEEVGQYGPECGMDCRHPTKMAVDRKITAPDFIWQSERRARVAPRSGSGPMEFSQLPILARAFCSGRRLIGL